MAQFKNFDEYIASAEPFAQPLLAYFRSCVQEACPEVEETFKWSMPNFVYKDNILCHMAAFKRHTSFSFWLASQMSDAKEVFVTTAKSGMGHFGKVTAKEQLPERTTLIAYVKEAVALVDAGVKMEKKPKKTPKKYEIPEAMIEALSSNTKAQANYMAFSPSKQNEYIEWISEAKSEGTRDRRITQMLEWLEEGKPRNWKYMKEYR